MDHGRRKIALSVAGIASLILGLGGATRSALLICFQSVALGPRAHCAIHVKFGRNVGNNSMGFRMAGFVITPSGKLGCAVSL